MSASSPTKVISLTTCHNRRGDTLAALESLAAQRLPAGTTLEHVIVDDGSGDGTADAVRRAFPDVTVIEGDGTLYWAGGMRFGWRHCVKEKRDFDYLFVYNDDTRMAPYAVADLLEPAVLQTKPHAIVGTFVDETGTKFTYGGRRRSSRWHPLKFAQLVEPNGAIQQADTLNMNGALISRSALNVVGFLSDYFIHSGADFEFGLKLRKEGGEVLVAPRHIGRCELNPDSEAMPQDAPTLTEGFRRLFDPKREPFEQRLHYYRAHGGKLWLIFMVTPYLTFLPRFLLARFSNSSRTVLG